MDEEQEKYAREFANQMLAGEPLWACEYQHLADYIDEKLRSNDLETFIVGVLLEEKLEEWTEKMKKEGRIYGRPEA